MADPLSHINLISNKSKEIKLETGFRTYLVGSGSSKKNFFFKDPDTPYCFYRECNIGLKNFVGQYSTRTGLF